MCIRDSNYYNLQWVGYWGVYQTTFASWQTKTGGDSHGIITNSNLNTDYTPKVTSPIVGSGFNLTSLYSTNPVLCFDKNGVARSSNGTWSIGAYEYPSYVLTVSVSPSGSGIVTSSPSRISCDSTCSASFASGTSVSLTASSNSGSTFSGWSGGGCSGTGTCTITMTAATSVTATFTAIATSA